MLGDPCSLPAAGQTLPLQEDCNGMATLAGIVAACSASLESLDLRVSWCCSDRCAHNLLVRPRWFPPAQSADTGSELQSCSCKRVPTPGRLRQCCAGSCTRCVWGSWVGHGHRDIRPGQRQPRRNTISLYFQNSGHRWQSKGELQKRFSFVVPAGFACTATSLLCSASCWGKAQE